MNRYIQIIADREGETPEKIYEATQEALELAWASDDARHVQARKTLSDSPTAPNLDEFLSAVVKEVQKRRRG